MTINLIRKTFMSDRTLGVLIVDGKEFCDTLEPAHSNQTHHAIPTGTYPLTLQVQSPRFLQKGSFKEINARLPRLLDVPNRDGILIHPGNKPSDTSGCILVGCLNNNCDLINSRDTFWLLYDKMKKVSNKGERILLHVL